MNKVNPYEIKPNTDMSLKEKPLEEQSFQERMEPVVEREIEDITTQIASNMRANLDPEIVNSSIEAPLNESPLSLDVLGQYFGNEGFIKKYVESDAVRERFGRFLSDLRNKIPHLSYKTAAALGSMVLMVAACSPIVSSPIGGSVPGGNEMPGETIALETEEEKNSSTPMPTETSFPTPSPTPVPTEASEPVVIVQGGTIEDIERNMEEGDLIWSMVELQKIVNSYDKSSGQEFSEYIAEVRQAIPSDELEYGGNYWGLDRVLGKLEDLGEMSTMSLIYALKGSFPGLILPNFPEGYDSLEGLMEDFPSDLKQKISEYAGKSEKGIDMENVFFYGLYLEDNSEYGSVAVLSQSVKYESLYKGYIVVDGHNYEEDSADFVNTIVTFGKVGKSGTEYPVVVMVDEEQQIRLIILSNEEANKIFTESYQIILVAERAVGQELRMEK